MLAELRSTRQIPGEEKRRWFTSPDMDLIVWFDSENKPGNFELCYDKRFNEKSLRCSSSGMVHSAVDGGENHPGRHKATPVLRETGHFDAKKVYRLFLSECKQLPDEIREFVIASLEGYIAAQDWVAGSHATGAPEENR